MKRILYKTDSGIAVIIPTGELSVEATAAKDVPTGLPYKIVDVSEIPSDRTFREAWEVDESDLTDGTGGEHDMFITDPQHPDYVAPDEVSE
jgi:hypothetical protein